MSYRIVEGHALHLLRAMPEESVDCVVTSPPYWGLRDYGLAPSAWGGDTDCEHLWLTEEVEREMHRGLGLKDSPAATRGGAKKCAEIAPQQFRRGDCARCGAWLGCFGLEPTPELYIEHAVEIFREVRRVLKKSGTCWVNMGDSYHTGASGFWRQGTTSQRYGRRHTQPNLKHRYHSDTIKPKDLVGAPWMLAFALRADGWYLRQDIIWAKPNPMPESVQDRCTKAHDYIFLLSKSRRYYWDKAAMREATTGTAHPRGSGVGAKIKMPDGWDTGSGGHSALAHNRPLGKKGAQSSAERNRAARGAKFGRGAGWRDDPASTVAKRNKRSVWSVATEPFSGAHFATFPSALVEPCILAGCPIGGVVLDPFTGSGTVGMVALRHGRQFLGFEMNPQYVGMAHRRIQADQPLFNKPELTVPASTASTEPVTA